MKSIEEKIREFAKKEGLECIGLAGPDRLNGPPSIDPAFIMRGAKSIVAFALPMDVEAIDDFLSKKSSYAHNIDQKRKVQIAFWKGTRIQEFIESLGYKAKVVRTNSDYRRSPDPFATHPSFSHKFGAIAAGIAAHGWSGNIMTKEYGAAVYLSTIVTNAEFKSDPALDPRHFMDGFCSKCKLCVRSCPVEMFHGDDEEEFILLNGEKHPRAKRHNLNLCNTGCFGLHSLSKDKKWSSWGRYWLSDWVKKDPDPGKRLKIYVNMLAQGALTGTSFRRYEVIRKMASLKWPESYYQSLPEQKNLPEDEEERERIQKEYCIEKLKVKTLDDYNVSSCAHCALICGPKLSETARRFKLLIEGGIVVPGPGGKMTRVSTYEEAVDMIAKYPVKLGFFERNLDRFLLILQFPFFYFGFNPKSIWHGFRYQRELDKIRNEDAMESLGKVERNESITSKVIPHEIET